MFDLVSIASRHFVDRVPRCLDLTCGDGSNLVRLADLLWDHGALVDLDSNSRIEIVLEHLVGFDTDSENVDAARDALTAWANMRGGSSTTPKIAKLPDILSLVRSRQRDLFRDLENLDHLFDFAIAEIPFETLDPETREASRTHLSWATGRFSSEAPYVAALWSMLAPDGLAVMTIRDVFFRRVYGNELIAEFRNKMRLVSVDPIGEKLLVAAKRSTEGTSLDAIRTGGDLCRAKLLDTIEHNPPLEHRLLDLPGEGFRTDPLDLYYDDGPFSREIVIPDDVSRWFHRSRSVFWPYDSQGDPLLKLPKQIEDRFSPWQQKLASRSMYGLDMAQRGRRWFEFLSKSTLRSDSSPTIVFVTRRGRSAAVVSDTPLPATAGAMNLVPHEPDDCYWLAGLLNSSVGTFWMQNTFAAGRHGDRISRIEPTGVQLRNFPVATAHRAEIESLSRSLHDASDLLFSEPRDDLEGWLQTVIDAQARVFNLEHDLNSWVERAYAVQIPVPPNEPEVDTEMIVQSTLERVLVSEMITLLDRGRLPFDRPFAVAEASVELKKDRRIAEVLARTTRDLGAILLDRSVPDVEPWISTRSPPRSARDYVGYRSHYPPSTKAQSRVRLARLRGPLNLATEDFVHLADWSNALHHPIFCRAPLPKLPDLTEIQFDIGRIAEMESTIASVREIENLIVTFSRSGWTLAEIRACLVLLEEQGRIVLQADHVVPVD